MRAASQPCRRSHPGPTQVWCKQCHALDTLLRRHQAWPPALFSRLSDDEQQNFWRKRKKEHEDGSGRFSYQRVRDVLCTSLITEVRKEKMVAVGGTYLQSQHTVLVDMKSMRALRSGIPVMAWASTHTCLLKSPFLRRTFIPQWSVRMQKPNGL